MTINLPGGRWIMINYYRYWAFRNVAAYKLLDGFKCDIGKVCIIAKTRK